MKKAQKILDKLIQSENLSLEQKQELDYILKYISEEETKNKFKIKRISEDKKITQNYLNISIAELESANNKILKANSQLVITNEKSEKNLSRLADANKNLEHLLNQQKVQSEISTTLKNVEKLDENINYVLDLLGKHTKVSRIYIFEDIDNEMTKNTYEWHAPSFNPHIDMFSALKYAEIPKWKSMLTKNGKISIEEIHVLPPKIKKLVQKANIKSILAFPLIVESKYFGFIGFDECTKVRKWSAEEASLLQTTANIISNAFERRLFINKLKKKNIELENSYSAIEKKNKKLNEIIDELEEFAYITTHDLKQPLRTILNFVSLFSDNKTHLLDDEAKLFLNFITESSTRLDNLINDMLKHSIIGKSGEMEWLDINNLIDEIILDLNALIESSSAVIEYKGLPQIHGYKVELNSLFQNLISNAIKYSDKNRSPLIQIDCQKNDKNYIFSIKDNGIGFNPKFNSKIFSIFQRLENSREIDGTGIGLAHCKKIVELHGGKIWADSKPDEGSTFYFSLPFEESKNS